MRGRRLSLLVVCALAFVPTAHAQLARAQKPNKLATMSGRILAD